MHTTIKQLQGTLPDPDSVAMPDAVRTPGKTWTEIELDDVTPGAGSVQVDAPATVDVLRLEDAYKEYPDLVEDVLFSTVSPDENRLMAVHTNHLKNAVFLRIPRGTVVDETIEITSSGSGGFAPRHVLVAVEDGAAAKVEETVEGDADQHTTVTEIRVGRDASLSYGKINALDRGLGYAENGAVVAEQGTINWTLTAAGSDLYREHTETVLDGPRSTLDHRLGFLAADEQHMDITAHVTHAADNTRCDIDARGVALDAARTIYKGVQAVEENAEGTQSFQDETTVMIGDRCEADTTPQLQIDNNDVEATHAATTGHIDAEDLFYLTSRGVREEAATREIVTGMFDDLLDSDTAESVVHEKINNTL